MKKTDSVRTPIEITNYLKTKYFKNDVVWDPTPYNENFSPETDRCGLRSNWYSPSFVNPPYSICQKFIRKAHYEFKKFGVKSIMLVKAQHLATKYCKEIQSDFKVHMFSENIHFKPYKYRARFTSVLLLFGYDEASHFAII